MKRIKTTVEKALKKGQLKVGDTIWIEKTIDEIDYNDNNMPIMAGRFWYSNISTILITKPEPVPIDFGAEGRILQFEDIIVRTAGFKKDIDNFSGYTLAHPTHGKGFTTNYWDVHLNWQDITETYNK